MTARAWACAAVIATTFVGCSGPSGGVAVSAYRYSNPDAATAAAVLAATLDDQ